MKMIVKVNSYCQRTLEIIFVFFLFSCTLAATTTTPTVEPTTIAPTTPPTDLPTVPPTFAPSISPTHPPTFSPTRAPTTFTPTQSPTYAPTFAPSKFPTSQPTRQPSRQPTGQPSRHPTSQPSRQPSSQPTRQPSSQPFSKPTAQPSNTPSTQPTAQPWIIPTAQPTCQPTTSPTAPTGQPSTQPSMSPSSQPTSSPTRQPSVQPSRRPSRQPSAKPTSQPVGVPSSQPSFQPIAQPSTQPSKQPTSRPSAQPSSRPTIQPSAVPSSQPSAQPTLQPSSVPSAQPSMQPSVQPSFSPSTQPSNQPTGHPSSQPSRQPSTTPSAQPSSKPTNPTSQPSGTPTAQPFVYPTSSPTSGPTARPSSIPICEPGQYHVFVSASVDPRRYICVDCPPGTAVNVSKLFCPTCPKGSYAPKKSPQCLVCPINYYADAIGQGSCTKCRPGWVNGIVGSTSPKECVNLTINLSFGVISLVATIIGTFVYIFFGRLQRIAFQRRTRLTNKCIAMFSAMMTTADMVTSVNNHLLRLIHIPNADSVREKILQRVLKPMFLYSIAGLLIPIITVGYILQTIVKVMFSSMILWKAYNDIYDSSYYDHLKDFLIKLDMTFPHINLTIFHKLGQPFVHVMTFLQSIKFDFSNVQVNCTGAQAPLYLISDLVILCFTVVIIESDFELLWTSIIGPAMSKIRSMVFNRYYVGKNPVSTVAFGALSLAISQIPPPCNLMRYILAFVKVSVFVADHGISRSNENCNNAWKVYGHPLYLDSILATASTVVAFMLLVPAVYLVSEVLVASTKTNDKVRAGEVKNIGRGNRSESGRSSGKRPSPPRSPPRSPSRSMKRVSSSSSFASFSSSQNASPSKIYLSDVTENEVESPELNQPVTPTTTSQYQIIEHSADGWTELKMVEQDFNNHAWFTLHRFWQYSAMLFTLDWLFFSILYRFGLIVFSSFSRFLRKPYKIKHTHKQLKTCQLFSDAFLLNDAMQMAREQVRDVKMPTLPWFDALTTEYDIATIKERQNENEQWKIIEKQLPTYWKMIQEVREDFDRKCLVGGKWLCWLLPIQLSTSSGWDAWVRVIRSFAAMFFASCGVWLPFVVEDFDLFVKFDEFHKLTHQVYGNGEEKDVEKIIPISPSVSSKSSRRNERERGTGLQPNVSEEAEDESKGEEKETEENEAEDIFTRIENDETLEFAQFVSSTITSRAMLLQLLPKCTELALLAGDLSSCPLFTYFDTKMDKEMPPLLVQHPFVLAEQMLLDECPADANGRKEQPNRAMVWFIGIYIFVRNSRLVEFAKKVFLNLVSLSLSQYRPALQYLSPIMMILLLLEGWLNAVYVIVMLNRLLFPRKSSAISASTSATAPSAPVDTAEAIPVLENPGRSEKQYGDTKRANHPSVFCLDPIVPGHALDILSGSPSSHDPRSVNINMHLLTNGKQDDHQLSLIQMKGFKI